MSKNLSPRRRAATSLRRGVLVLLCVAGLLAACDRRPEEVAPGATVTAGQIIENPTNYVGKTVTVTGQVEALHGPRAFEMDSGINFGELLVVGKDPFPQVPDAATNRAYLIDDTATVTGTVRMMVVTETERELGWDLTPELETEFDRKPVLIAQSLTFTPRAATASPLPTASPMAALPTEVQEFVRFAAETKPAQVGLKHEYTNAGLTRLHAALAALVNRAGLSDGNPEQRLEQIKQRAGSLQDDQASLKHANQTRQAFIAAAELMATLQQQRYPDLSNQVAQVRQAAEAVSSQQKLLDQTAKVETFFQRAGDALQAMAR